MLFGLIFGSFTTTPVNVVLPVLVSVTVYSRTSPTATDPPVLSLVSAFTSVWLGVCVIGVVSVSVCGPV